MRPLQEVIEATKTAVKKRRQLKSHQSHLLGLERLTEQVLHGLEAIGVEAGTMTHLPRTREKRRRILFNSVNALGVVHKRAYEYAPERTLTLLARDIGFPPPVDRAILHYEDDEFQIVDLTKYTHLKNLFGENDLLHAPEASAAIRAFKAVKLDLVGLPASEAENSLAWGLLYHEYMHKTDLPAEIYVSCGKSARQAIFPIWNNKGEIFTDFAALLVLGPAYGYALAEAPEKFGHHGGRHHPDADVRFWLARATLTAMHSKLGKSPAKNLLARELCKRALEKLSSSSRGMTKAERDFVEKAAKHIAKWIAVGDKCLKNRGGSPWHSALAELLSDDSNYYGWKTQAELIQDIPALLASGILPAAPPRLSLNLALLGCKKGKLDDAIVPPQLRSATACAFSRGSVMMEVRKQAR